jgi:hypothetical protein
LVGGPTKPNLVVGVYNFEGRKIQSCFASAETINLKRILLFTFPDLLKENEATICNTGTRKQKERKKRRKEAG